MTTIAVSGVPSSLVKKDYQCKQQGRRWGSKDRVSMEGARGDEGCQRCSSGCKRCFVAAHQQEEEEEQQQQKEQQEEEEQQQREQQQQALSGARAVGGIKNWVTPPPGHFGPAGSKYQQNSSGSRRGGPVRCSSRCRHCHSSSRSNRDAVAMMLFTQDACRPTLFTIHVRCIKQ